MKRVARRWTASFLCKALVPTRRTCKCVLSTCKNVGKIWGSVRGEYRLSTDLGACRHSVALLVHEDLSLRSGCGRATDSPPVRVTRVPSTANERTTHWLRESFKFFPRSLALRTAHLARACCARDKCVVRAYSALPQFNCRMSTQNSRGPYRVSTCSALISAVYIKAEPTDECQHNHHYIVPRKGQWFKFVGLMYGWYFISSLLS